MSRRHLTTALTLAVLAGLIAVGAVVGWNTLTASFPTSLSPSPARPACTNRLVDAGKPLRSSDVTVSVFNAGSRPGLAERTLSALTTRGFQPGQVGNAPSGAPVRTAQVWTTTKGDAESRLVALQFGRQTKVHLTNVDLGPGVDVLVGDNFHGLAKAPQVLKVSKPEKVCVPLGPSPHS